MKQRILLTIGFFTLLAVSVVTAQAQDKSWVPILTKGKIAIDLKTNSAKYGETGAGQRMIYMTVRFSDTSDKTREFYDAFTTLDSCERGRGDLIFVDAVSGKFQFKNTWIVDGGTIAAQMGTILCNIHSKVQAENARSPEQAL